MTQHSDPSKQETPENKEQPAAYGGMTHRLEYDALVHAQEKKRCRSGRFRWGWIAIAVVMLAGLAVLLWLGLRG